MLLRRKWLWFAAVLWVGSVAAQESGCPAQARTPLEQTYCKVRAANPSAALPSLQELRRNPEKTQRLLLRRPAEQAGISLPPETAPANARPSSTPAEARRAQVVKAVASNAVETSQPNAVAASLAGCEFGGTRIRCGTEQFLLQGNLPNSRLAPGALAPDAHTSFAEYEEGESNQAALMTYASATYRHYIEAMLDIGLGASTMSFTKFYHTLTEAQSNGARFGERLAAMFDFLKKDKATIGVQPHYNDALPEGLSQCMALSELLLVCDNVQQNWVYRRVGR
jgi:hypothetical protein